MVDTAIARNATSRGRTVQQWIDERPQWPDGTAVSSVPMTGMQWLIWSLAAAGKFFEGFVVFMTGVALPLFSAQYNLGSAEHGVIGAASLFGILIGAVALGGLSDRFGRKMMFIVELVIFVAFLLGLVVAPNYLLIVACLFFIGLSLGCDYPTAHMIISENISAALRKFLLWAIAPDEMNDAYLAAEHFIPLPAHIWVKSHDQIEAIR
jgi:putative MFS transporter